MPRIGLIIIATQALVVSVLGADSECYSGWTHHRNSCYRLYHVGKTWKEARQYCRDQKAHLATIMDVQTRDFLKKTYFSWHRGNVWLGLNGLTTTKNRGMEWADTNLKVTYTDWAPGEPKGNTGCTYIWEARGDRWDDGWCGSRFHFLCEKSAFETCRKTLMGDTGLILSPKYPTPNTDKNDCKWTIQVDKGQAIRLVFYPPFELHSNCRNDYLKVSDVAPNGQRTSLGTWCGEKIPPVLTSSHSKVDVEFKAYGGRRYTGFAVSWQKIGACGGIWTSKSGTLSSPGYPGDYPRNQECRWVIDPPDGGVVSLHFGSLFSLKGGKNCAWDYVEVFKGTKSVGRWCADNAPPKVTSKGQKLVVIFKSDATGSGKGFSATWTSE